MMDVDEVEEGSTAEYTCETAEQQASRAALWEEEINRRRKCLREEVLMERRFSEIQLGLSTPIRPDAGKGCALGRAGMDQEFRRDGKVREAWDFGTWHAAPTNAPVAPRGPCACTWSDDGVTYKSALLTEAGVSRELNLTPGVHAFVKVANEKFLRVNLQAAEFGAAVGHPLLADETAVLFAGEIELDCHNQLRRWSNMSGTYKCDDAMCFQTGLPIDKFWTVMTGAHSDAYVSSSIEAAPCGTVLCKVFTETDEEALLNCHAVQAYIEHFKETLPDFVRCHLKLFQNANERQIAVKRYGYRSTLKREDSKSPRSASSHSTICTEQQSCCDSTMLGQYPS